MGSPRNSSPRAPQRKRSRSHASDTGDANDDLPQPYNARALHPAKKRAISPSEQPRKQKRPQTRSRMTQADRDAIRQRQLERERERERERTQTENEYHHAQNRAGINDVVRQHYNSVPERGRDWRKTDSKIKGLRSFNNWVKSCIIQKFSPNEDWRPGSRGDPLLVLDIGCGKGGDLGKWQQAPQPLDLYVGLDPADVSISQARDRLRDMQSRGRRGRQFDGRFMVKDCFGESLEDIEVVRQVGFNQPPGSQRGFDVVSMMFCMHYAFESEAKARQMLQNVAGALKKGGRFLGCIPNSDVLSDRVRKFNDKSSAKSAESKQDRGESPVSDEGQVEEGEAGEDGEVAEEKTAEWGNSIYRIRFASKTPEDGIFRPAFGWKYNFFLDEAVEEVPEYVVPWEAFRALAEDYNLELQYHKTFEDVWDAEKDDNILGPLSERMGVRNRGSGELQMSPDEIEASRVYLAFCFYKV
ncbi:mRNA cap guanine-N7 methyltransferase [Ceratocystis platani]|uniref:mRNA cap guanine-N(7) methyltransferase n=1 Tax=Ceratocystis fimbriata f. sp. platani TaxID=88771 RepID=A0A0F8B9B1_CERFI|nr:mRNA cap guanine-N7 methyltransferase [Ceratocystis platani]